MATNSYFAQAQYEQAKRGLTQQRDAQLAQNAYSRFLSQTRGSRNLENIGRQWAQRWRGDVTGLGRRGLVNSGLYGQGLSDAARSQFNQTNDARLGMQADLRNSDLQAGNINAAYQKALADLELQLKQQQAEAAAQLLALRG